MKTPFEQAGYTEDTQFKIKGLWTLMEDDGSASPLFHSEGENSHFLLYEMEPLTEFDKKLELLRRIHNGEACWFHGSTNNSAYKVYEIIKGCMRPASRYVVKPSRESEIKSEMAKLQAELDGLEK